MNEKFLWNSSVNKIQVNELWEVIFNKRTFIFGLELDLYMRLWTYCVENALYKYVIKLSYDPINTLVTFVLHSQLANHNFVLNNESWSWRKWQHKCHSLMKQCSMSKWHLFFRRHTWQHIINNRPNWHICIWHICTVLRLIIVMHKSLLPLP